MWLWDGAVVEQHETEECIPGMDSYPVSLSIIRVCQQLWFLRAPVSIPRCGDVSGQLWLMCNSLQNSSTSSFELLCGSFKIRVFDLKIQIGRDSAMAHQESLKEIVWPYGKYAYSLSYWGLDEKFNTTMLNIKLAVSLAEHITLGWNQGKLNRHFLVLHLWR